MATKPSYDIPHQMREMADKSVDQARQAFEGFMQASQSAMSKVETSANATHSASVSLQKEAMNFAEEQVSRTFQHAQKIVRAKDPQEMMSLQAQFMQEQMKLMSDQARTVSEKFMNAASETIKKTG
jgi:phasin